MKRLMLPLMAASVLFAPVSALAADWTANFDGYTNGQVLNGVDGWSGWDSTEAAAGIVSNSQSLSAPNSLAVTSASDAIREFTGINSGQWVFEANVFLPAKGAGTLYFIMLNKYSSGGDKDWSVQLPMNLDTGVITDDNVPAASLTLLRGAWSNLRIEIDFDADSRTIYYNDQLLSTNTWTTGTTSLLELQAIDLFGNTLTTTAYYDDLSATQAVPEPATIAVLALGTLAMLRRRRK